MVRDAGARDEDNNTKAKTTNPLPQLSTNNHNDVDNHHHHHSSNDTIDKFAISVVGGGDDDAHSSSAASPLALKSTPTPRSGRGGWEHTPLGSLLSLGHLSVGLSHDKVAIAPETTDLQEKERGQEKDDKGLTISLDEDWEDDVDGEKLVAQHSPLRNKPMLTSPPSASSEALLRGSLLLRPIDSATLSSSSLRRKPTAAASTTGNDNGNTTTGNGDGSGIGITIETTKHDGYGGADSGGRDGLHSGTTSTSTSRKGSVEQSVTDIISSLAVESTSTSTASKTIMCRLNEAVFTRPRAVELGLGAGVADDANRPMRHRDSLLLERADRVVPGPGPGPGPVQRNNCPIAKYYPPSWGGVTENNMEVLDTGGVEDGSRSVVSGGDGLTIETTTTDISLPSPQPPLSTGGGTSLSARSVEQHEEPSSRTTDAASAPAAPISNGDPTKNDPYTNVEVGGHRKKAVAATSHHHRIITPTPIISEPTDPSHAVEGMLVLMQPMTDNAIAASLESVPSQGGFTTILILTLTLTIQPP